MLQPQSIDAVWVFVQTLHFMIYIASERVIGISIHGALTTFVNGNDFYVWSSIGFVINDIRK